MTKAQKKRPPKTPKEKSFAKEYVKTGNATEAASRTYKTKNRDSARNIGSQNVAKLSFDDIFDNSGLTDSFLITSLIKATKATKYSYSEKIADWNTRLKAIEICMKLKGTFSTAEFQLQAKLKKQEASNAQQDFEDSLTGKRKELMNKINFTHYSYFLTDKQKREGIKKLQSELK